MVAEDVVGLESRRVGRRATAGMRGRLRWFMRGGVVRLGNLGMSNRAGLRHSALPTSASLTRLRPARCWAYRHRDPHSVSLLVQAPQCAIRRKRLVARKELLDVMNDMIVCMQNEEGLNASMSNLQLWNPYLRRRSFIVGRSQSNRCSPVWKRAVAEATIGSREAR